MAATPSPQDLVRVDAYLRDQDGKEGDLGGTGREFARTINRLQRLVRMVLLTEDKTFRRTVQRWRLVDTGYEVEVGTERRGAGVFALIARWAAGKGPSVPPTEGSGPPDVEDQRPDAMR